MSVSKAIKARWNDSSLDSLIKDIWPGSADGPELMVGANSANIKGDGGPNNESMPRARYNVMDSELVEMTASSKVYAQRFFIFLYSKNPADLTTWTDAVIDAFENSHFNTVNPFEMDEGCVIHLDWVAKQDNVSYGDVKFSELLFECVYVVPRVKPS